MREARPEINYDGALGRQIIELHVWAVRQGLLGTGAAELFDGFCQRLVLGGLPLWRASAAMRTLHPEWGGYSYLWRRDLNAIEPSQFERDNQNSQVWLTSPFAYLVGQAEAGGNPWLHMRRRLTGPEALLDFPLLEELASAGAADYFAKSSVSGRRAMTSRGTGIGYSFATDRREGFGEDDLTLLQAVLPALSLAMMTHAGHTIASGLLASLSRRRRRATGPCRSGGARFGRERARGAVVRRYPGLYSDCRRVARDSCVIELLNEIFEIIDRPASPSVAAKC